MDISFDILQRKSMQLFLIWAHLSGAFHVYTLNEHEGLQKSIHRRHLRRFGNVTLYYVVLDKILSSLRDRFENNRALCEILSVFHPSNFSVLVKKGKIVCDLIPTVKTGKIVCDLIPTVKTGKIVCDLIPTVKTGKIVCDLIPTVKTGKIVCDLIPTATPFCERYHLDFIKCAEELLCFSRVYSRYFQIISRNVLPHIQISAIKIVTGFYEG